MDEAESLFRDEADRSTDGVTQFTVPSPTSSSAALGASPFFFTFCWGGNPDKRSHGMIGSFFDRTAEGLP